MTKIIEKVLQDSSWKVKVRERAGKSIKRILTTSDPLLDSDCGRPSCFIHSSGGKGDCRQLPAPREERWWAGGGRLATQAEGCNPDSQG